MPITVPFIPAGAMCIKPKSINRTFKEKPPLFHFGGNGCFNTRTLFLVSFLSGRHALLRSGPRFHQLACGRTLRERDGVTGESGGEAPPPPTPLLRPDSYDNQVSFGLRR